MSAPQLYFTLGSFSIAGSAIPAFLKTIDAVDQIENRLPDSAPQSNLAWAPRMAKRRNSFNEEEYLSDSYGHLRLLGTHLVRGQGRKTTVPR